MRASRSLPWLLLACISLPVCAAAAEPTHQTLTLTSRQQAEDREHPGSHLLPLVVTRPLHSGARVCARYENDVYLHGNKGRAQLEVELWRDGALVTTLGFGRHRVRVNQIDFGCRDAPRLRLGDTLLFDFRFFDMPRLAPRPFSHGGLVHTAMWVSATVEPPLPSEPSTIEFRGVEPAFGSKVALGGKIKVRIAFTCNQPLGCNVVAGFDENGRWREEVRWVRPGSRTRKLTLRCPNDGDIDLVKRGLLLEIERAETRTLDSAFVAGKFTCLGDGS